MTRRNLQRLIHVGAKQLGLDSATRHDLQLRVTGKASMADMSEGDLRSVAAEMKRMGFRADAQGKRPPARRADIRFCHVMWRLLVQAGEVKVAGAKGLNAFIRARFERTWGMVPIDIDTMTEWEQINDVVQALREWCRRAGVDLDK